MIRDLFLANRSRLAAPRLVATLAGMVFVLTGSGTCSSSDFGNDPGLPAGFSISIVGPLSFPVKGQGSVTIQVTRVPGMTGDITVGAFTSASGLQATNVVVKNGTNTAIVPITTDGTGTDKPSNTLEGHAWADGYKDAYTTDVPFTFLQPGRFGLQAVTVDQAANPGFVYHRKILIVRDQYAGAITFSNSSLNEYPYRFTPATTTGNSVDLEADIPATAASSLGSWGYVIATGPGGVVDTLQERYVIRAPTYQMVVTSPQSPLTIGTIGQAPLAITRDPGFTSAVTIPSGTKNYGLDMIGMTIPSAASQGLLQFRVQEGTRLGLDTVYLAATPPPASGGSLQVLVRGFYVREKSGSPIVQAGGPAVPDTLIITRVDFPDPIAITAFAPGLTVTVDSASTKGNQAILSVSAPSSATVGEVLGGRYVGTSGTATDSYDFQPTVKAGTVAPPPPPPPPSSPAVVVSPHVDSVSFGRQTTIAATVTNGSSVTDVTWQSKDASVATVVANGSRAGVVSGAKAGAQTYIVATYTYFGGVSRDSTLVSVTPATSLPVASITMDPLTATVTLGQQVQYRVHYFASNGREIDPEVGSTTNFTIDSSPIGSIGLTTGLATTRGEGSTKVNATYKASYYPANQALFAPQATLTVNK